MRETALYGRLTALANTFNAGGARETQAYERALGTGRGRTFR